MPLIVIGRKSQDKIALRQQCLSAGRHVGRTVADRVETWIVVRQVSGIRQPASGPNRGGKRARPASMCRDRSRRCPSRSDRSPVRTAHRCVGPGRSRALHSIAITMLAKLSKAVLRFIGVNSLHLSGNRRLPSAAAVASNKRKHANDADERNAARLGNNQIVLDISRWRR